MKNVDLSYEITNETEVFPGDINVNLKRLAEFSTDGYTIYTMETGMHSGTHIEAPMHMTYNENHIGDYDIGRFVGNAVMLDVRGENIISMKEEYFGKIKENSIVLLYTGWSEKYGTEEYFQNYPVIDEELADFLIRKKIKVLGMDSPSPDKEPYEIHKILFQNGVFILENLTNLSKLLYVEEFEVFAQPLKINAEASLVRAFAQYKGY